MRKQSLMYFSPARVAEKGDDVFDVVVLQLRDT
jgi:hypothetical protein